MKSVHVFCGDNVSVYRCNGVEVIAYGSRSDWVVQESSTINDVSPWRKWYDGRDTAEVAARELASRLAEARRSSVPPIAMGLATPPVAIVLFCLTFVAGCINGGTGTPNKSIPNLHPIVNPIIAPKPDPTPVIHQSNFTLSAPQSLLSMLHQYLQNANTVTLKESLKIIQPDVSVTIPAGSSISFVLSESQGVFTFNAPKPIAEIVEFGVKIHPTLDSVTILPNDTGSVLAEWNGFKKTKSFDIKWRDRASEPSLGTPEMIGQSHSIADPMPPTPAYPVRQDIEEYKVSKDSRPEVWMFIEDGQAISENAEELIDAANASLPFQVIKKTNVPGYLSKSITMFPSFYWPVDANRIAESHDCRMLLGWVGVEKLTAQWKGSRKESKVSSQQTRTPFYASSGNPWYENGHHTSVQHLLQDHHAPASIVNKYKNDRRALDLIHGNIHEGRIRF